METIPIIKQVKGDSFNYCSGSVQSIAEYKKGVQCGLFIEYHSNGTIRAIRHYKMYSVNRYVMHSIPDWKDASGGTLKDTTFPVTESSRQIGQWFFFSENGILFRK